MGGLGVHNVKMRAMAMLIHTFLAQTICPNFSINFYLNTLYRWHVLGERDLPDPGRPPYYSALFFNTIRDIHLNTPLNVSWITVKQWYQLLLEGGVTHTNEDPDTPPVLISTRMEERFPEVDFQNSYRLSRLFGLSPEQKSFLFTMMQNLLPTRERLARLGKTATPSCLYCTEQVDTIHHLLTCPYSSEVAAPLFCCLADHVDILPPEDITKLNFKTSEAIEMPLVWILTNSLMHIWEERQLGKKARLVNLQASCPCLDIQDGNIIIFKTQRFY